MITFHVFITEAYDATKKTNPKAKPTGNGKAERMAADKHVAITFGRFNPPHAGHGKMLDAVQKAGGDSGNYRIYPSRTQDHKKNPLSADQKVDHMRRMFKNHKDKIQNSEQHRNIFDILRDLNDEGHEHVTMVVGDDRVKEFQKLTDKYNGKHYNFKSINIKSGGARNKDSEDPVERLSASNQRKYASSDDHDSFHLGMPKGFSKAHSLKLMADVKAGMTPPEKLKKAKAKQEKAKTESWLFAPKLNQQELRERYIEEEIFEVGTLVEYDDTGIRGTIVHRGSNYVILKDEHGDEFRTWLHHVTEVTDASKNREDQSNFSADDGSGNDWKVGTDKYRQAVQAMTPGQATTKFGVKFSDFRKTATPK